MKKTDPYPHRENIPAGKTNSKPDKEVKYTVLIYSTNIQMLINNKKKQERMNRKRVGRLRHFTQAGQQRPLCEGDRMKM